MLFAQRCPPGLTQLDLLAQRDDHLLKRPISSARCRSERPPTVFDWLIRHWFRNRAALTRPNFGTAMSMSNTFAVETYSGGLLRICSMRASPDLRSFLSRARRTRMSFARLSASIRWSRERSGAWAWVLSAATAGGTNNLPARI